MDELAKKVLASDFANVYVVLPGKIHFTHFAYKLHTQDPEGTYFPAKSKFLRADGRIIHLVREAHGRPERAVFVL